MKLAIQEDLIPGKDFSEKLRKAEQYGFEAIELWGGNLASRVDGIAKAISSSKMQVSSICIGFRGCLLSAEKDERDTAVKDINNLLRMGSDLGALGLIVVPIFGPPRLPDLSPWKKAEDIEKNLLVELLGEIGVKAEEVGCLCLLEPLNRYETHLINRTDQAIEIAKRVNGPGIKVMADFFHMSIEETRIDGAIERGKDFIHHVHLADSNRLLPGHGHTDFRTPFAALRKMEYSKYMALECTVTGVAEQELPKCVRYLRSCMG